MPSVAHCLDLTISIFLSVTRRLSPISIETGPHEPGADLVTGEGQEAQPIGRDQVARRTASAGMCVTQCCHRHPPHPCWRRKKTHTAELEHHSVPLCFLTLNLCVCACVWVCVCVCVCACLFICVSVGMHADECTSVRVGWILWLSF